MSRETPRLRMFAGPNGSGKSVLKSYLPESLLGVYLNPDEIEANITKRGCVDLQSFGIQTTEEEVLSAFTGSQLLHGKSFSKAAESLTFAEGCLFFPPGVINSYFASVLVDFIRGKLLQAGLTFTFETVMSHPSKVDLLAKAQQAGPPHLSLLCRHRRHRNQCLPCGEPCRVERARCPLRKNHHALLQISRATHRGGQTHKQSLYFRQLQQQRRRHSHLVS